MKLILDLDIEKCSACGSCVIACMDQNDVDVSKGQAPFRSCFAYEDIASPHPKFSYYSMTCMHCENAPCIAACPSGCLKKDEETNLTVYDNTNCIGCHSCSMACPFGAPAFGADGKMVKCDGCLERVRAGLEPACTRICPAKAIRFYTDEEYGEAKVKKSLQKIAKKLHMLEE